MRNLVRYAAPLAMVWLTLVGCDTFFTEQPPAGEDFESPLDGLDPETARMFAKGDENFEHVFSVDEGVGPIFNNMSCGGCHPGDGRGTPNEALVRFSMGLDLVPELGGPQLQDRAIPGSQPETLPPGADRSLRLPPPVFGVGFIEAIPVTTILANRDSTDTDLDSISGRPNWVTAPDFVPPTEVGGGPGLQLGRFGRKANVSSLIQQVSEAYHQDMGVTSDFLPTENENPQAGGVAVGDDVADPEIPALTVLETVVYVRFLSPPAQGERTDQVKRGEQLFEAAACASCHVPSMKTGPHAIAALNQVDVPLYSDLLLHDMGPGLADNRPDGSADGNEWKTAPLWGTRIIEDFLNGQVFFLHDGRATSIREAIQMHGGEAQPSRNNFMNLSPQEQDDLIAFIKSL